MTITRPVTRLQHYCHNCRFWEWDDNIYLPDGTTIYPGHCGLYSCKCINAVADGRPLPPPSFLHMEGVDEELYDTSVV